MLSDEEREKFLKEGREQIFEGVNTLMKAAVDDDGTVEIATEWSIVIAAVSPNHDHPETRTMYYRDSGIPAHWGVGLLDWGLGWLKK